MVCLVLESPEGTAPTAALALGVAVLGLLATVLWTRIVGVKVGDRPGRPREIRRRISSPNTSPHV